MSLCSNYNDYIVSITESDPISEEDKRNTELQSMIGKRDNISKANFPGKT